MLDFSQTWTTKDPCDSPFRDDDKVFDPNGKERISNDTVKVPSIDPFESLVHEGKALDPHVADNCGSEYKAKEISSDLLWFLATVDLNEIMGPVHANDDAIPSHIETYEQENEPSYQRDSSDYDKDPYNEDDEDDSYVDDEYHDHEEEGEEYVEEDDHNAYDADDDMSDDFSGTATTISELTFDDEEDCEWMLNDLLFAKESEISDIITNDETDDFSRHCPQHEIDSDDDSSNGTTPTVSATHSSIDDNATRDARLAVIFRSLFPHLSVLLQAQGARFGSIEEWTLQVSSTDDHVVFRVDMRDHSRAILKSYDAEIRRATSSILEETAVALYDVLVDDEKDPLSVSGKDIMASLVDFMA